MKIRLTEKKNLQYCLECLEKVWEGIQNTSNFVPNKIKNIFYALQKEVREKWPEDENLAYITPGGFIFLRIFCAALMSPHLFNLADAPVKFIPRNLVLVSKTIMNLANLVPFGQKESCLEILNEAFIMKNIEKLKKYIDVISTPPTEPRLEAVNVDFATEMSAIEAFFYTSLVQRKQMDKNPLVQELIPIIKKIRGIIEKQRKEKFFTEKPQKTVQIIV